MMELSYSSHKVPFHAQTHRKLNKYYPAGNLSEGFLLFFYPKPEGKVAFCGRLRP